MAKRPYLLFAFRNSLYLNFIVFANKITPIIKKVLQNTVEAFLITLFIAWVFLFEKYNRY